MCLPLGQEVHPPIAPDPEGCALAVPSVGCIPVAGSWAILLSAGRKVDHYLGCGPISPVPVEVCGQGSPGDHEEVGEGQEEVAAHGNPLSKGQGRR